MRISAIGAYQYMPQAQSIEKPSPNKAASRPSGDFGLWAQSLANINRVSINTAPISFGANQQPLKHLLYVLTGDSKVNREDDYTNTENHLFRSGWKKWIKTPPWELLSRTPDDAIRSVCTLAKPDGLAHIPDYIPSPWYGYNWGRYANYIEINPRTIALRKGDGKVHEGLLNTMKLLPAVPASGDRFANCVLLSQLFPTPEQDGQENVSEGLYRVDLQRGISKNLTSDWLRRGIADEDLVKAFNDLAHIRGLKTGFRMPLCAGQIFLNGTGFDWNNGYHKDIYINACVDALKMGFDAIFFDSAKHTSGDYSGYKGDGAVPDYGTMKWITYKIREEMGKVGRNDISLIGEKCTPDHWFEEMGFTAGTDWSNLSNPGEVYHNSKTQKDNSNYAAGPEVSNDNDTNWYSFEERQNRFRRALFEPEYMGEKLPIFMQMHDLWPLSPHTNTHEQMEHSKTMGLDNYRDLFNTSNEARIHTYTMNEIFGGAVNQ